MQNPSVWGSPERMQKLNQEKSHIEKALSEYHLFKNRVSDAEALMQMGLECDDETTFVEAKNEMVALQEWGRVLELKKVLNSEVDGNHCFLSINSGAGGTEACDWASMIMRMYSRYAQSQGWSVEVEEISEGEETGIKSVTLHIAGAYAYGYLKGESGVHRLVRISPFDSNARRHTSFASVFVWPEIDDDIRIDIRPDDLRVETFRASGAGGQHVNRTDSAVRMHHIPTGVVVACQTQRSQIQNRERALKMLKAALYQRELEAREKARADLESTKKANEWGSQIRSYVLHPYKLVKDNRTQHESSQAEDVLNGDLEDFVRAFLKSQLLQESDTDKGSGPSC
jgi:peptide chain release factor 2